MIERHRNKLSMLYKSNNYYYKSYKSEFSTCMKHKLLHFSEAVGVRMTAAFQRRQSKSDGRFSFPSYPANTPGCRPRVF